MWDLVPWPGIEPRLPELGVWSISYCTTREVLGYGTLSIVQRIWEKWVRMDLSRVIRSNSSGKKETAALAKWFRSVQSLSPVQLFATLGLQYCRLPRPSPTPRGCSNSGPSSQWCHPTISSSVIPFSSCLQSFPASGSFQMSQFFTSGGQTIGVSASTSVLSMNTQDWFPLGLTFGSPCSLRDSQESSPTPQFKHIDSLALSFLNSPTLTFMHNYWKNQRFD